VVGDGFGSDESGRKGGVAGWLGCLLSCIQLSVIRSVQPYEPDIPLVIPHYHNSRVSNTSPFASLHVNHSVTGQISHPLFHNMMTHPLFLNMITHPLFLLSLSFVLTPYDVTVAGPW
jgi:hypothetical protein